MFLKKISQNLCINTFNKDIQKKFRKNVQDPTMNLLDPKVEFGR